MIDLLGHYQAIYTPKINLGEGSKLLIKCDNITPTYVHDRVEFGLLTARMGGFYQLIAINRNHSATKINCN